jgi:hypothetical protein
MSIRTKVTAGLLMGLVAGGMGIAAGPAQAAPASVSANCAAYLQQANYYQDRARAAYASGNTALGNYYQTQANNAETQYRQCEG